MRKKELTGYASIDNPQNEGYSFSAKHPIIPPLSVYDAIKAINLLYMKKTAIDCEDIVADYEKLFNDAVIISRALKELGIKRGSIVSVCMPNFYQAVASFLACNRIGATITFLDTKSSEIEINDYLNLFESEVFINYNKTEEENIRYVKNTGVKNVITLSKEKRNSLLLSEDYDLTTSGGLLNNKDYNLFDFNSLASVAGTRKAGFSIGLPSDNALMLFTSGSSTGDPKVVVLTNKNVLAAGTYLKNSSRVKNLSGDRTLVCVPFAYPYGFTTSTLMTLLSSKTAILAPDLSEENISYYLQKYPNIIFGSPAILELMIRNVPEDQDLSSITTFISGGDFFNLRCFDRAKTFFEKHGAKNVEIGNGHGNAETVSCGANPTGVPLKKSTAGKILTGTTAMIVDEMNKELKYGEEGLLLVAGGHVFKEYFKDPKATKKAIIELAVSKTPSQNSIIRTAQEKYWTLAKKFNKNYGIKRFFKTGTIGNIDNEGYFTPTGRQGRYKVNSTADKIYCDKIQNLIINLDCVDSCAVICVPDEKKIFVPKVYIVLKKGIEPSEETKEKISDLLQQPIMLVDGRLRQLKTYELPVYIEFKDQLPRIRESGKVDYSLLEKESQEELLKEITHVRKIK